MSEDFSSRPATKPVRSDQDHSKASTKEAENPAEEGEEHIDEDWLSQPPFSVGKSWDGWTTKWRESCWCGKGGSSFEDRG